MAPDDYDFHKWDDMTVNDFRDLMARNGVDTASCPTCGANAWGGFETLTLWRMKEADKTADGSIHALSATCGQCGFLWMFDREVIG